MPKIKLLCSMVHVDDEGQPQSKKPGDIITVSTDAAKRLVDYNMGKLIKSKPKTDLAKATEQKGKPAKDSGAKTPETKVADTSNNGAVDLAKAIRSLDATNDDHWTSKGLPSVAAVEEIIGERTTRGKISAAIENFTREVAAKAAG